MSDEVKREWEWVVTLVQPFARLTTVTPWIPVLAPPVVRREDEGGAR
jgi:hypothetical protein